MLYSLSPRAIARLAGEHPGLEVRLTEASTPALLREVRAGRVTVAEGFPDRGYTPQGRLVPRDRPGALVEGADAVAEHAVALARAGGDAEVRSLCVHGDSPGAVATAHAVRAALGSAGMRVRAWTRS